MTAASVPEKFFAAVTKFVLGQGGILWENTLKLLRSKGDGTNWTVHDDPDTGRSSNVVRYNVNWRGGYADTDTSFKKPAHEISWRGEYARNYHDGHPIPRMTSFAYNGQNYAGPGGSVMGGCVYTPTTGALKDITQIYICSGSYTLYRKPLADIGTAGGWTNLGQIPLGNTGLGGLSQFRSIFFAPDGSKAVRVSWIWTTAKLRDDVERCDFTEYTMLTDGSQIGQTTYQVYGPWGIDITGTSGVGGTGNCAMNNTSDKPILGADYAPDGTLKTFAVSSWDVTGAWVDLELATANLDMNQTILLNFDGFIYRHVDCDLHTEQFVLDQSITCDFTEIHFADLRYHTLVYSDYIDNGPTEIILSTDKFTRFVRIRHQTVGNVALYTYICDSTTPRIGAWLDHTYMGGPAVKYMLDGSNPQNPEKFILQKPWGNGNWPDISDYYQGNLNSPASRIHAIFGLNLSLAERTRPTSNDPVNDNNVTDHWAAENPQGGLVICLPNGDSLGGADPDDLTFYMTGGQNLVTLLATVGIAVTIDRSTGHSFAHVKK